MATTNFTHERSDDGLVLTSTATTADGTSSSISVYWETLEQADARIAAAQATNEHRLSTALARGRGSRAAARRFKLGPWEISLAAVQGSYDRWLLRLGGIELSRTGVTRAEDQPSDGSKLFGLGGRRRGYSLRVSKKPKRDNLWLLPEDRAQEADSSADGGSGSNSAVVNGESETKSKQSTVGQPVFDANGEPEYSIGENYSSLEELPKVDASAIEKAVEAFELPPRESFIIPLSNPFALGDPLAIPAGTVVVDGDGESSEVVRKRRAKVSRVSQGHYALAPLEFEPEAPGQLGAVVLVRPRVYWGSAGQYAELTPSLLEANGVEATPETEDLYSPLALAIESGRYEISSLLAASASEEADSNGEETSEV